VQTGQRTVQPLVAVQQVIEPWKGETVFSAFAFKTVSPLRGLFSFVTHYLGLAPPPADLPQAILFCPFRAWHPVPRNPLPRESPCRSGLLEP
jgi:hypothetical protein